MQRVLVYCWKEWRLQRGILLAYALLVFTCLAIGLSLVPRHLLPEPMFGAHALTWFVAAGAIGVVLFAVPQLVRGEFGAKDDQFVRRLPGALGPSFAGKLLFLVLVAAALPLFGLALGELYVTLSGSSWSGLFRWWWDGSVSCDWFAVSVGCGLALLATPWVWAVGMWLPSGRMAIGGTVLLALLVEVGLVAVLRQSPSLEKGISWDGWLWYLPLSGAFVAAASWLLGRRGGGPLRSARFGLVATSLALLPPGCWLAVQAWHYHHPDLQRLERLEVRGLSPDLRFAVAVGNASYDFDTVPFRIDLATGAAEQLGGTGTHLDANVSRLQAPATKANRRFWRLYQYVPWCDALSRHAVLDLATGAQHEVPWRERTGPVLDEATHAAMLAELRSQAVGAGPGGMRVWFEDDSACFAAADGQLERLPVPGLVSVGIRGQGAWCYCDADGRGPSSRWLDFASRSFAEGPKVLLGGWLVRGTYVFAPMQNQPKWHRASDGQADEAVPELDNAWVLGLYDDDRLLCRQAVTPKRSKRLFLYDVAARAVSELAWPTEAAQYGNVELALPLGETRTLLPRDPAGRIWLGTSFPGGNRAAFVLLDTGTATLRMALRHSYDWRERYQLLAWLDGSTILVQSGARILRVDVESGRTEQLFPRP